ncbi:hypothetical protein BS47DRAFT_1337394, partial [Hydnum rufescens UP504]
MCMWCTATRNLQRPELDWRRFYPLYDDRDACLFQATPFPGVADPPLSFVHSVTTQAYDGKERVIPFSPENEARIESLVESFNTGFSPFARLTIHIHISFTTHRCSDGSLPICPLRFSTSAKNAQFVYPHTVTRSTYISKWTQASDVWKAFNPALCRLPEMPSCSFCGIVVSIPALPMLALCQTSMRRVELEIISPGEYTTSALLTIEDILTGHTRLGSLTLAGLCLTYALSKMSRQN